MSIAVNNLTYVGVAYLAIERVSDNLVYAFPQPQGFTVNTGATMRQQEGRSAVGQMVRTGAYKTGEMPELTISYNYMNSELIAFSMGNELISGSFATHYPKLITVTAASIPGDTVSGNILNGLSADIDALASYKKDGISISLTRQPFATFAGASPANDDSFAIGADGALKFSDNLVANNEVVALKIPKNMTGVSISDILVGQLSIQAALIDTLNQVTIFEATNAAINMEGKSFDFSGEGGVEMSFYLNNPPGACRAWDLIATTDKVSCI